MYSGSTYASFAFDAVLSDRRFQLSYCTGHHDLVRDFFVPAMEHSVLYRRAAGYFTSAGLALAAWHSGLYAGILPAPIVPCTENGPSCTGEAQVILGVPIPYLSMVAFVAVLACLLLPKGQRP